MRVVVTGANGFIGKPLCKLLAQRGHEVKSIVRDNPKKYQVAAGDITQMDNWSEFLEGCNAVIHLAALVHEQKPSAQRVYDTVNTHAVKGLMHTAAEVGVKHLVFLSTAAVYNNSHQLPHKETDIPSPDSDYGYSKLRAEQLITEFCNSGQLTYTILRPPMVYGPDAKANFDALVKLVLTGAPLPFAAIPNMRSFIYVENLTQIIEASLDQPSMENEIFNVSDLHDLSTTHLVQLITKYLGKKERLFYLPSSVIRVLATAIGKRSRVEKLLDTFRLDPHKLDSHMNWKPPFSVEQAIEKSVASYRKFT